MSASWAVLLVSYLKLSMIIILATFLRSIYFCEKEEESDIKFFKRIFFNTASDVCPWLDVLTIVSLDFIIACVFLFLYLSCSVIDDMEKNLRAVQAAHNRIKKKTVKQSIFTYWIQFDIWALYLFCGYVFCALNIGATIDILYLNEDGIQVSSMILNDLAVMDIDF